jgi:cell division protein FtsI (penicillin-binding protein 3)
MAEQVGSAIQRAWMEKLGMFARTAIELPESRAPQFAPAANWGLSATLTVAFGHGISVTPLHVVAGTAAVANGGVLMRPTLLAADPLAAPQAGTRVMQQATSDIMRRLMRLVVTDGFGKSAEVPGYYIGGKTGTAEKKGGQGYQKHANVASFMAVFPMNAPRYAVYLMLDEPKATASTHGYATAGWVAAPAVGRVIDRAAPLMGMQPDLANAAAIQAQLAIPLQPGKGPAMTPRPPALATSPAPAPVPAPTLIPASVPARDLRQQIMLRVPDHAGR